VQHHGLNGGVYFEPCFFFFFFFWKVGFYKLQSKFYCFACSTKSWLIKNIFFYFKWKILFRNCEKNKNIVYFFTVSNLILNFLIAIYFVFNFYYYCFSILSLIIWFQYQLWLSFILLLFVFFCFFNWNFLYIIFNFYSSGCYLFYFKKISFSFNFFICKILFNYF